MKYQQDPYPFKYPEGKTVAFLPSVVFEVWSDGKTPSKNIPGGGFISANTKLDKRDLRVEQMIEFGSRVGMPRLLEILDREGVNCTVLANGLAVEMFPEISREYAQAGHEFASHGYTEDTSSYDFDDPEEERKNIIKTTEVIEKVIGKRPTGWLSPRATPSVNTMRLLTEEGFLWVGDYPNDELPYVATEGGKDIVVIPYSALAVNDYQVTMMYGNAPESYVREFSRTLDFLREEAALTGRPGLIRASVHAHVYGHNWGRWAWRDVIRYAKSFKDVWIPTREELAQVIMDQHKAG